MTACRAPTLVDVLLIRVALRIHTFFQVAAAGNIITRTQTSRSFLTTRMRHRAKLPHVMVDLQHYNAGGL